MSFGGCGAANNKDLRQGQADGLHDTGQLPTMRKMRRTIQLAVGLLLAGFVASTGTMARADITVMTASAANNAALTVTLQDATAEFGSNLDPKGTDSNSTETVVDYQGDTGNQGSYYVWAPDQSGNIIQVSSNKVWSAYIGASENTGFGASETMTIASGVLKYVEGSAPASYATCAAGSAPSTNTWKQDVAPGRNTFAHFYCLRVDWDDAPGTFFTSVSYTINQS